MQANPYDWMNQSREHRHFAQQNYPTISGLGARSNGYPAFALLVQSLPGPARAQYTQEWNQWNNRFGRAWGKLGCVKELKLGQYTDKYRWTSWSPGLGSLKADAPPFMVPVRHRGR
jgi:hypothetical protein